MSSINPIYILRSHVISYFYSFKDSFLYYPVIFTVGGLALFLLTSRLDESFERIFFADSNAVTSYFEPLFFAGSPNAARSILSTIATGWATILGVAFSVTLITLQLAATRYASELINEFQNSKTNQLALAWFILTVTYSLLVLKTVRTGEDEIPTFTPILGVNLSVYLAAIALFVFVLFLNNITSYLKPNLLIEGIVGKVHRSIELYENRVPDRRFIFKDNNYQQIKRTKILEIRSPNSGIIRSLDWEKISDHIRKHNKLQKLEQKEPLYLLEWLTPVGGKVKQKEVIAIIYSYGELPPDITERKENIQEDLERMLQGAISSGLKIGQNRSVSSDPHYGLEIIRNLAIKATNQSDIATITSSITGLFSILYRTTQKGQLTGTPFMIPLTNNRNNSLDNRFLLTADSREREIAEGVLSELSIIYYISGKSQECAISVAEHFATAYVGLSRQLLSESKIKDFEKLTEWYAKQTSLAISLRPLEFRRRLADILEQFKKEITYSHPYAIDTFQIHLNKILTSEA